MSDKESPKRGFVCERCGKALSTRFSLNRHREKCYKAKEKVGDEASRKRRASDGGGNEGMFKRLAQQGGRRPINRDEDEEADVPVPEDQALADVLRRHWTSIRSWLRRRRLMDMVNCRVWEEGAGADQGYGEVTLNRLLDLWRTSQTMWKINCSPGCLLEHKTSGELRYYHSSSNNATLFTHPRLIQNEEELREFYRDVTEIDLRERALQRRPNTSWVLRSVTNLTFYIYKMIDRNRVGSGRLPRYLRANKSIIGLDNKNDSLCFFRCLALLLQCKCNGRCHCKRVNEKGVMVLFNQYCRETKTDFDVEKFRGVTLNQLLLMERLFKVNIVVSHLRLNGICDIVWSTRRTKGLRTLYMNLHDKHFSYIKDIRQYGKTFACKDCSSCYNSLYRLRRHVCRIDDITKMVHPGGEFKESATVFDKIREKAGIRVDEELQYYPYVITYDCECMLIGDNLPENTDKLSYMSRHELLSISVCSNVPGFTEPKCLIRNGEVEKLVRDFVDYISLISETAEYEMSFRFAKLTEELNEKLTLVELKEKKFCNEKFSNKGTYVSRERLSGLDDELRQFISAIPVVGFNSQRYDVNVMKGPLMRILKEQVGEDFAFVVKKTNSMAVIENRMFRFMDVCNFIAPGFNYDKYLKSYGCQMTKGFFPYEWMDCLQKLDEPNLPPKEAFSSSLKNTIISEEDYSYCQTVWKEKKMKTFRDFLIWYNNLDVQPFVEALEKQKAVYRAKGIDMLKSAISLPGLAMRWMFKEIGETPFYSYFNDPDSPVDVRRLIGDLRKQQPIYLMDEANSELDVLLRNNLVGGPSIIFSRYHEKGKTMIRGNKMGAAAKPCRRILGLDANALYLYCMTGDMPSGYPFRRLEKEGFRLERPQGLSKLAHGWLEYLAWTTGFKIKHKQNGGEVRLGRHNLPVDGFDEDGLVFQFHGCFWHGHPCHKTEGKGDVHPYRKIPFKVLFQDTIKKQRYLQALGYHVETMWECQWEKEVENDPRIKTFLASLYKAIYPASPGMDLQMAIEKIRNGDFFGLVECDIHVPSHLEAKFAEMAPIFKNVEIGREHLGEHMKSFVETNPQYLRSPQRMLIGSLFAKKMLFFTELLQWYLRQGLVITRIYQMVEYIPRKVFDKFATSVSNARRQGDANPDLMLLANTSKLIGNSAYGKTIANKKKYKKVRYVGENDASAIMRSAWFESMDEIDDSFYEMNIKKTRVNMDVPTVVGFVILQRAKLRMLEFYYDFMDRFVDRSDFELMEMDTDSSYAAIAGDSLESVIRKELLPQFYAEYGNWFPRLYCDNHREEFVRNRLSGQEWVMKECCEKTHKFDLRTPGLFKEEFVGEGMIALNSKTYFCWTDDGNAKYSSKGLSKATNKLTKDCFMSVLESGKSKTGVNKGFARKDGVTYTYNQLKTGLTYFYVKRQVCSDGVSTENISC